MGARAGRALGAGAAAAAVGRGGARCAQEGGDRRRGAARCVFALRGLWLRVRFCPSGWCVSEAYTHRFCAPAAFLGIADPALPARDDSSDSGAGKKKRRNDRAAREAGAVAALLRTPLEAQAEAQLRRAAGGRRGLLAPLVQELKAAVWARARGVEVGAICALPEEAEQRALLEAAPELMDAPPPIVFAAPPTEGVVGGVGDAEEAAPRRRRRRLVRLPVAPSQCTSSPLLLQQQ